MPSTTVRKTAAFAVPVATSTVITCVLAPAFLPRPVQATLGWMGLIVLALLVSGRIETTAVRVLYRARGLSPTEQQIVAPARAIAGAHALEPACLLIARRPVDDWAVAVGRRTVVISPRLVAAVNAGQVGADAAAAITGRAAGVCRAGMTRTDPALIFWTIPWHILSTLSNSRGTGGIFAFAWTVRPIVAAAAIYLAVTSDPAQYAMGGGVAALLGATYVVPRLIRGWDAYVADSADRMLAETPLGRVLADHLRQTLAPSISLTERLSVLDPQPPPQRGLRLVS